MRPTATGTLTQRPLCELLVYVLDRGLSGSLVLETPRHDKHALSFRDGVPVKAKVASRETRLGELLRAQGRVDDRGLAAAAEADAPALFGERLIALGAIDRESLVNALHVQLVRQIAWLARLPGETAYGYYDHHDFLQGYAGEPMNVDPLALVASAAFANPPRARIAQAMAGLGQRTLRFHSSARVQRFGFSQKQRVVIDVLRAKPQPLAELEASGLLAREALHELLYVLALTCHLDLGKPPLGVPVDEVIVVPEPPSPSSTRLRQRLAHGPPSSVRSPEPAAPAAEGGTDALDAAQIKAKLESLESADYYELLEIPEDADAHQIAAAFPALARRWHPDRLSRGLAAHKDAVTRIFARLSEVHRTLNDPELRRQYDEQRLGAAATDDEQEQVQRVLAAVSAFRKAEVLVKKRDFAGAEALTAQACQDDPEQPEYAALHAWLQARRAHGEGLELTPLIAVLDDCVRRQTNNPRIHYYRASVLKLAGREADAVREFRQVAELDPHNVEAQREIRLYEMRSAQARAAEPDTEGRGLLSRFFKR